MIVVPPRHYCLVENPAIKDKDGKPVFDTHGQVFTHLLLSLKVSLSLRVVVRL